MYRGSMRGAGSDIFAVWGYAISHVKLDQLVELNPEAIRDEIGMPLENVNKALAFLESPDPRSREQAYEGRRLVKQGMYEYLVVTAAYYRGVKSADDLREYNRVKQRESRARKRSSLSLQPEGAVGDGVGEEPSSDNITREMAVAWAVKSRELGSDYTDKEAIDAWLYYTSTGWMVGKSRVADYRTALEKAINHKREWSKNDNEKRITVSGKGGGKPHNETGRSIGTLNEGTAHLYAGIAKTGKPKPQQDAPKDTAPVAGVQPVQDVQRPDAGSSAQ